jgi:signal peptidase I
VQGVDYGKWDACRTKEEYKRMSSTWKQKIKTFWHGWGWSLLLAVLIATSFRSAIADWNDVPTGSMLPTILEGDRIFVNKLAYDLKVPFTTWHIAQWGDPQRGDIVVFFSPADGKRLVKRVIGLPGDTIALKQNHLLINGQPVQYDPVSEATIAQITKQFAPEDQRTYQMFSERLAEKLHPVMLIPGAMSLNTFGPIVVPAGSYFLMGDNRDNSADSRYFGFVERRRIVGRATAIALSLDYSRHFRPRWERFFSRLP